MCALSGPPNDGRLCRISSVAKIGFRVSRTRDDIDSNSGCRISSGSPACYERSYLDLAGVCFLDINIFFWHKFYNQQSTILKFDAFFSMHVTPTKMKI
eukprot:COSAG05_NODE_319_length_11483_cov_406.525604_6_plen_98_part_00